MSFRVDAPQPLYGTVGHSEPLSGRRPYPRSEDEKLGGNAIITRKRNALQLPSTCVLVCVEIVNYVMQGGCASYVRQSKECLL